MQTGLHTGEGIVGDADDGHIVRNPQATLLAGVGDVAAGRILKAQDADGSLEPLHEAVHALRESLEAGSGVFVAPGSRFAEAWHARGRDRHPRCFTMWLAGGGVKPGLTYGSTDDFSYNIAENGVHVRDLHATVLHLLGIDHERLTHRFSGLDFRLTGVEPARVVREIMA